MSCVCLQCGALEAASTMAWSNGAVQLATLLAASAALQQAAAVQVASVEEFVAALEGGEESIEVTNHLYLNSSPVNSTAGALSLAANPDNAGYLISLDGDVNMKITVRPAALTL